MGPLEFIALFTDKKILKETDLYKLGKRYYIVDDNLRKLAGRSLLKPDSIGIFVGEEIVAKDNTTWFKPGFALIDMIKGHAKTIELDDKTAWLFLCGRDILPQSVQGLPGMREGELALVSDSRGLLLGVAEKQGSIIKNRFDRGDFLRRERAKGDLRSSNNSSREMSKSGRTKGSHKNSYSSAVDQYAKARWQKDKRKGHSK